jgi:hypothetical protein
MLSVKLSDLFFSQFYESHPITPFPKVKKNEILDPGSHHHLPDWFEGIQNGSFVLTLGYSEVGIYDWSTVLHRPITHQGLLMDLPPIEFPIQIKEQREGLRTKEQTLEILKQMGDSLQEKMARKLVHYGVAVGLSTLSFKDFRILQGDHQWGMVSFNPQIFQNPSALHSKETTMRIITISLMRELSINRGTRSASFMDLEPIDPKISPFFNQLKELHQQSIRYSFTKIFLSILSVGILPLYYLIQSAITLYKITKLYKKLEKRTFIVSPYIEQARRVNEVSIKIQHLLRDTKIISSEPNIMVC